MFKEFIVMPDNTEVYEPNNVKYLGVQFDNKLTFKKHTDILCCKLNRMVGILWRNEHLNLETKKIIYSSMVESHLNYGILTWASNLAKNITGQYDLDHTPENLKLLCTAQNKIIRAIVRKPKYDRVNKIHTSMSPLFKTLETLTINDLYYYNLAIMAHEYFHANSLPVKINEKFTKKTDITEVRTRYNEFELYYNTPRLASTFRKPSVAAAAYWNTIPIELRIIKKLKRFKKELKVYMINKY